LSRKNRAFKNLSKKAPEGFPNPCPEGKYITMSIFKAYDIRGIYGKELDESLIYRVGKALARYVPGGLFLLGYDARLHSRGLSLAVASGILEEGKRVEGVGLVTSPQLHFLQIRRKADVGVMVTASHNPREYHGIKIFDSRGGSLSYDKGLKDVEAMVTGIPAPSTLPARTFPESDCLEEYVDFIVSAARGERFSSRVVIDASNGSGGRVFRRLSERLGLEATMLNAEPDGNFPNHDPNPLKEESKAQASATVLKKSADFGVILDGDGDRILFVDEKGRGIENYFLCCLVAEELLREKPGSAIVYDLISSRVLPERIEEAGGKAVISRVGYTFLHDRMVATGAIFGGETSGHVYFRVTDQYYTESAAYALVVLLRLLARSGKRLSEIVEPLRGRYAQSPEINVEVKDKEKAIAVVREEYSKGRISLLDGVSVEFEDFWFNVRPSNTEPLLRLRLEAKTRETAERRSGEIKKLLLSV
jgi:phosphomannomutase